MRRMMSGICLIFQVIVSVIMAVASVQMIVQSIELIFKNSINPIVDVPTLCIM